MKEHTVRSTNVIARKEFSFDAARNRKDRVWPHGSRAERAHPTELCAWKATTGAGPYFWRIRGAPREILIERRGDEFDSAVVLAKENISLPSL